MIHYVKSGNTIQLNLKIVCDLHFMDSEIFSIWYMYVPIFKFSQKGNFKNRAIAKLLNTRRQSSHYFRETAIN